MKEQHYGTSIAVAGSAFALGVVTGLLLKENARRVRDRVGRHLSHLEYERTINYDESLPDSLGRRELPPDADQPRFGGTGALGVHPASAVPKRP
jgi:hypothetical protein